MMASSANIPQPHLTLLANMASPAVMARGILGLSRYDVTNELQSISQQTLVIAANNDRLTKSEASAYMSKQIPNARLVTVGPGNHQALLERHTEVNRAAEEFIWSLL